MGLGHPVYISEEEYKLVLRSRQVKEHEEYQYLHLMEDIFENGVDKNDRTGTGTRSLFGTQMKFDLSRSFPLLTTKKVYWRGVVEELLWFIRGETDANKLSDKKVYIWEGNTSREFLDSKGLDYPEGFIGPGYGFQWRKWNQNYCLTKGTSGWYAHGNPRYGKEIDQLAEAIKTLKENPDDRRIIVSAWNPSQLDKMALPPCHMMFQFYVENSRLHCQWYQRSCDLFLGVPFNISSYALLTYLIAAVTDLTPGTLTFCGGDTHIYHNHFDQVKMQLKRKPFEFPQVIVPIVNTLEDIENLSFEDIGVINYQSHSAIKAKMAI